MMIERPNTPKTSYSPKHHIYNARAYARENTQTTAVFTIYNLRSIWMRDKQQLIRSSFMVFQKPLGACELQKRSTGSGQKVRLQLMG